MNLDTWDSCVTDHANNNPNHRKYHCLRHFFATISWEEGAFTQIRIGTATQRAVIIWEITAIAGALQNLPKMEQLISYQKEDYLFKCLLQ